MAERTGSWGATIFSGASSHPDELPLQNCCYSKSVRCVKSCHQFDGDNSIMKNWLFGAQYFIKPWLSVWPILVVVLAFFLASPQGLSNCVEEAAIVNWLPKQTLIFCWRSPSLGIWTKREQNGGPKIHHSVECVQPWRRRWNAFKIYNLVNGWGGPWTGNQETVRGWTERPAQGFPPIL